MNAPRYPYSARVDQVDDYHGHRVLDPYRWLEKENSPARAAWIDQQNALTAGYLSQLPVRDELRHRFIELLRYARNYDLVRRGPYLFFTRNEGLQNQLSLRVQRVDKCESEVLIDPCSLAPDGLTRISAYAPSKDARYLAYGIARYGSDWNEYHVMDLSTRRELSDCLSWVKASGIAWHGDGFYYSRYPPPPSLETALTAPNTSHQVWYHRVGTLQTDDELVYEDLCHPGRLHLVTTTADERYVVLRMLDWRTGTTGNAMSVIDTAAAHWALRPVVTAYDDMFYVIDGDDDGLLVITTRGAPNGRLIRINPASPEDRNWREVIPETELRLDYVSPGGGKLFAIYRADAAHRVQVYNRSGLPEGELQLPGIGCVQVFPGKPGDTDVYWSFWSFTVPHTVYRYEIASACSSPVAVPVVSFASSDFETKLVWYSAKDGTPIPMYLVHRTGLILDGSHSCLLHGYGGNGVSLGPDFDPFLIALLERGVVYAVACLRGGGEYGDAWHRAGRRENKQTVFDDCIAAAEWLQASGYTRPERAALMGMSNGGLLVGAVMTQRPDLFKVALPDVGVMDMLRFQHFTLGLAWAAEFGSSDDPTMFPILLAYSPLHNVRNGVLYPATLVTTSESDDCVVPAHSFKFAATLQNEGAAGHPYLIRIDKQSGHGPVNLEKAIEERADVYTFLLTQLDMEAAHAPAATANA